MRLTNEEKVLKLFFDFPTEKFHIREIARRIKLNPNTILKITDRLVKENLLLKNKKSYIVEIGANIGERFFQVKRLNNFQQIYDSRIIEFLVKRFSPESISVVGSYSRGQDIESSDIDIVIISKENYHNLDLKKFENKLNRKIHLIVTDYKNMSDEFYINLINGFVLEGFLNKK